ncbi:hypothetical protein B0I35DRAFT_443665 [Stachybotrys elegans]|uniref:Uncharacterized protein n=1 Tax=Stachybotrys elegans TaxID=80388 RepID=A0A8K0WKU9_9HYPO|nr:hypothetical protein B0I35DRAFT_443665 [Stachybotrys elegans]
MDHMIVVPSKYGRSHTLALERVPAKQQYAPCCSLDTERRGVEVLMDNRTHHHRRPKKKTRFLEPADVLPYMTSEGLLASAVYRHEDTTKGKRRWSCRPCAKQAFKYIKEGRSIQVPTGLDSIQGCCVYSSDTGLPHCALEQMRQQHGSSHIVYDKQTSSSAVIYMDIPRSQYIPRDYYHKPHRAVHDTNLYEDGFDLDIDIHQQQAWRRVVYEKPVEQEYPRPSFRRGYWDQGFQAIEPRLTLLPN